MECEPSLGKDFVWFRVCALYTVHPRLLHCWRSDGVTLSIYLYVGSYGRENYSSGFGQSTFGKALQDGTVFLPDADGELPYVFVGD